MKKLLTIVLMGMTSGVFGIEELPEAMRKIMVQEKYQHAIWGVYVKDLKTSEVLYDLNSDKLFSPASTTKLFTVAALLHAYGDDYRFKTPVYSNGVIENGTLSGNLILIGQGDFTFGGRQSDPDHITYTKMDHITANEIPGTLLTPQDPLQALDELARQIAQTGIKTIKGDVLIDDSLFESTVKRGMTLSPVALNENLIDFMLNPSERGQIAKLTWRPVVRGYTVSNGVTTGAQGSALDVTVEVDEQGRHFTLKGTIPADQTNVVRTAPIVDPKAFMQAAFIQALEQQNIKVTGQQVRNVSDQRQLVAKWISPPLSEYGKLILKVSHNYGANMVPLLLASQKEEKTFDAGMRLLGDFATQTVKLSPDSFVFIDGAGGNENRLTPRASIALLEWIYKQPKGQFQPYFDALPILGVDGSLEDFAKHSKAAGKVRAKPGTGVALNTATGDFFLITQAFAGYIQGKNGHLYGYEVVVNNGKMPTVQDIFPIFEDEGQLSSLIYEHTAP